MDRIFFIKTSWTPSCWPKPDGDFINKFFCTPGIFYHNPQMLKINFKWISSTRRSRNSIDRRNIIKLFLKGAKNKIPENKDLAEVFVKILLVDCMVHPVMRWGDQYVFQNPHFVDVARMVPKLHK